MQNLAELTLIITNLDDMFGFSIKLVTFKKLMLWKISQVWNEKPSKFLQDFSYIGNF